MEKDKESPATTSLAYDTMRPSWDKVQAVLDGTETMRGAGVTYLPQHENESKAAYTERLQRCTLLNLTKLTRDSWVGRPFAEPIGFTEVPKEVEVLLDNVDLVGNDVHVFSRNLFADGIAKGYSHVLVDYPKPRADPDGRARSLADDEKDGLRPYWVHIQPERLIFADARMVDGREVLREIRIMEHVTTREGMAEVQQQRIRRILVNPDTELGCIVELWVPTKKMQNNEPIWRLDDTWVMSIKRIPLVTFYADRRSFMMGKSPLEDLADLNIAHWQSTSDQRAVLTVARFPMLALSGGVDDKNVLTIGPFAWLWSPDPKGKFYYVEHSGAAIAAGDKDLANLAGQMAEYGALFLKKAPSGQTATARALDTAESTSQLQDMVKRFGKALNQLLDLTAEWMGKEDGGEAQMCIDFSPTVADQAMLNTLRETRKMREISRTAYLLQLLAWGVLPEDYDAEADKLILEKEQMDLFGSPGNIEEEDPVKEEEE